MFFNKKEKIKAVEITDQNFSEMVMENKHGVFLDFWASWCGPCKMIGPIVDELANDFRDKPILIGKVNVDQNPKLSELFGIKSIPSLLFIKEKRLIESIKGMVPKPNLEEMLNDLIAFEFADE